MFIFFLLCALTTEASSRQREFHPKPLTEPCLIVSHHTALVIQIYQYITKNLVASGKINSEIVPESVPTIGKLGLNSSCTVYTFGVPT